MPEKIRHKIFGEIKMTWKNTIRKSGIAKAELNLNDRDVTINHEQIPSGYQFSEENIDVSIDYDLEILGGDEIRLAVNKVDVMGYVTFFKGDEEKEVEIEISFDEISRMSFEAETFNLLGNSLAFQLTVEDADISLFYNDDFTLDTTKSSVDYINFVKA